MSSQLNKRQLRSLSLRVASSWLKIAFSMDEFARISWLEGMAGKRQGAWSNKGRRGFGLAQEAFPNMHPNWTTTRDTGLYKNALAMVSTMLKDSGVTHVGPDDIMQTQFDLFYNVGKTNRKHGEDRKLMDGKLSPKDRVVGGAVSNWLKRKAINEINKHKRRPEVLVAPTVGPDEIDPLRGVGTESLTEEDRMRLMLMAMRSRSPLGNRIRGVIDREIQNYFGSKGSRVAPEVVRLFWEKIQKAPGAIKGVKPEKLFGVVTRKIRNEIAEELEMNPNQVTNILGGKAKHVLKFMEHVGDKANIESLVEQFADEIEYLEAGPGVRFAKKRAQLDLPEQQIPVAPHQVVQMLLEKDRAKNWDEQVEIDTHSGEPMACGDVMADKEISVGPLTFTVGPVPGAGSGAMRFAAQRVAGRWAIKQGSLRLQSIERKMTPAQEKEWDKLWKGQISRLNRKAVEVIAKAAKESVEHVERSVFKEVPGPMDGLAALMLHEAGDNPNRIRPSTIRTAVNYISAEFGKHAARQIKNHVSQLAQQLNALLMRTADWRDPSGNSLWR